MKLKVAAIQSGAFAPDDTYESYMKKQCDLLADVVKQEHPYLAVFQEAMTGCMFAAAKDDKYFGNAETIEDGPTTKMMVHLAREHNVHIVYSIAEKRTEFGQTYMYNTACLVSPTRGFIGLYHKCHMPWMWCDTVKEIEKYYFKPGSSFPVYKLDNGAVIGMLICYDRSFPEAWRMLQLQGAQIICVPACSWGFRGDMFVNELSVRAYETHTFVVATNRAGYEHIEGEFGERTHFGRSCIIGPMGDVLKVLDSTPWSYTAQEIDLEEIREAYVNAPWLRDRRPELYGLLTAAGANFGAVFGSDYIETANKIV